MTDKDLDLTPSERFKNELKELQSELSQLAELDEMERNYMTRLVDWLKLLQVQIDVAIPIHAEVLIPYQPAVKQAYLVSEAVAVMVDAEGGTTSLPLSRMKPQDILSVVQDATPALREIISEKRKLIGGRVDLLERLLKDMKKASGDMKPGKQASSYAEGGVGEEDLIRSSITSE